MKVFLSFAALFALVAISSATSYSFCPDPSTIVGKTLAVVHITKPASILGIVKAKEVYPQGSTLQKPILCIILTDNLSSTAEAKISSGGVGYTWVEIQLVSPLYRGLDYTIQIYSDA